MSVLELGLPWAAHSADMLKQPHGSVGAKGLTKELLTFLFTFKVLSQLMLTGDRRLGPQLN